jgi:hypothetical protein
MYIKIIKERSPFVLFLPFLLFYIVYVCIFHQDQMVGDEARYIQFAQNLLNGFYSPAYPDIDLINGPGYPILLMPFVAFKLPLICITLLNAVLHFLSVVYVFKSIQLITPSFKTACITAICWGCYVLAYQEMAYILTESFTAFLVTLFSFQIIALFSNPQLNKMHVIQTGIVFGFIALTKVIFAYVIVAVFLIAVFLIAVLTFLLNRRAAVYKKFLAFSVISFLTLSPYVIYTYHLTGKVFYLSTVSGEMLYWMSAPNEQEYGDWNNHTFTANCNSSGTFCNSDFLKETHSEDFIKLDAVKSSVGVDSLFKKLAIENIKAKPLKYIKNWFANIGRLLFGFPASYYFQSPITLVRIYVNSIVLLAMIYSLIVSVCNWKNIPLEIKFLIGFSFIYLGLSSLVSAYPRQFNVLVPAIFIWVCYALKNTLQVRLRMRDESDE